MKFGKNPTTFILGMGGLGKKKLHRNVLGQLTTPTLKHAFKVRTLCPTEVGSPQQHIMSCALLTSTFASHTFMLVGRAAPMTSGFSWSASMILLLFSHIGRRCYKGFLPPHYN
ncbi:uncharacterized protein LOC132185812 [Corylus avellana]|uniref:uncharacterized protein LOC132185812 n=1 Tax=Corylus avellana TaxID=13451 RepID=UPI00286BAC8F|nr:uncharacterized protein LOC132185812 [Corylus avellana]